MAVEGDDVQRLLLAQRNPKYLDAFGRVSDIRYIGGVELDGEDEYRKLDHQIFQTCVANNVDDGDKDQD